jgi:hypothetical protein
MGDILQSPKRRVFFIKDRRWETYSSLRNVVFFIKDRRWEILQSPKRRVLSFQRRTAFTYCNNAIRQTA